MKPPRRFAPAPEGAVSGFGRPGATDMTEIRFELRGEYIALDALLKATGLAPSGGVAKLMVANGDVQVDGRDESRKTAKIRGGQIVSLTGARVHVIAGAA